MNPLTAAFIGFNPSLEIPVGGHGGLPHYADTGVSILLLRFLDKGDGGGDRVVATMSFNPSLEIPQALRRQRAVESVQGFNPSLEIQDGAPRRPYVNDIGVSILLLRFRRTKSVKMAIMQELVVSILLLRFLLRLLSR